MYNPRRARRAYYKTKRNEAAGRLFRSLLSQVGKRDEISEREDR